VVVGIDGSEPSRRALVFGCEEAARRGTGVVALHAWTKPWHAALRPLEAPAGVDRSFLQPKAAALLADSVAAAARDFPNLQLTERLVNDQPGDAILEASRGADLLVVGCGGSRGLVGRLLGSVSRQAIHHAHCPVAVIP
jgi:nucleotide-binding universal stress UspA family protein